MSEKPSSLPKFGTKSAENAKLPPLARVNAAKTQEPAAATQDERLQQETDQAHASVADILITAMDVTKPVSGNAQKSENSKKNAPNAKPNAIQPIKTKPDANAPAQIKFNTPDGVKTKPDANAPAQIKFNTSDGVKTKSDANAPAQIKFNTSDGVKTKSDANAPAQIKFNTSDGVKTKPDANALPQMKLNTPDGAKPKSDANALPQMKLNTPDGAKPKSDANAPAQIKFNTPDGLRKSSSVFPAQTRSHATDDSNAPAQINDSNALPQMKLHAMTPPPLPRAKTPISTAIKDESSEVTSPEMDEAEEMPQEWQSDGKFAPLERTSFSAPQTLPEPPAPSYVPAAENFNVHLEKGDDLPTELQDIIDAYDDEILHARTRDGSRECAIQLAIARILEHADFEKLAYVRYLKALEADGSNRTAIRELRRIARAYNKPNDVMTLLQSAMDTSTCAEEQSIMLEECGWIVFFADPPQHDNAISMLHRAITLTPRRISPHMTLILMFLFEKRFEDCCDIIEKLLKISANHQIASFCHTMLGDLRSSLHPMKDAGLNNYLQLLELQPDSLYAFQHASGVLLRTHAYQTFCTHALKFAKAYKDKDTSQGVLLVVGAIANDMLSDVTTSDTALEMALHYRHDDRLPLELMLENYASDSEQWQICDKIFERLLSYPNTPKQRSELLLMRALNIELYGNSTTKAIEILRELCTETPTDPIVLHYYLILLRRINATTEIIEITKRLTISQQPEETAKSFANLGCYCMDVLKNAEEAEVCFRNALLLNPNQRMAFECLDAMLRARKDYDGVIKLYLARLDVVLDARSRASMLYSLATICDYSADQPENAILYYQQYREIFPDDIHAIHNLERLYTRIQDWRNLVDMYLIEKEYANTPLERCNILMQIASICRFKLGKLSYAFAFLNQAKEENPNSIPICRELLEITSELQNWTAYIDTENELLALQTEPTDRINTLFDMAFAYEAKLYDSNAAVNCYEQILSVDPNNSLAYTKLCNIYRTTGNLAAFYELSLDHAQRISSPIERARLLFKVGLKTLTLFKDIQQSIPIIETAYSADPTYTPTVSLLSIMYTAVGKIDLVTALLQEYVNTTHDQTTKNACAATLAYLKVWVLKTPDEAIHPIELSLALNPSAINIGLMLILAQYDRGAFSELAALFTERAQNTTDQTLSVFFYNTAAFFAHRYPCVPGSYDGEITALRAALAIDADDVIANERLEAMEPSRVNLVPFLEKRLRYASASDKAEIELAIAESIFFENPQQAFASVCKISESNPNHLPAIRIATNMAQSLANDALTVRFLAMQAQILENVETRIAAYTLAAQIAEEKLNLPDNAAEYYQQAFLLAPQRLDLCDNLLNLLRRKKDLPSIDAVLQIHTRSISHEDQIKRFEEMADIYLNELDNPQQALIKLRQVVEINHENINALQKLANLAFKEKNFNEARGACQTLLELDTATESVKNRARMMLADIYNHLNQSAKALPLLQDMLAQDPNNADAIERLAALYFEQSKLNDALALLLKLRNIVQPPKLSTLLQIASIYQTLQETEKLKRTMADIASIVQTQPQKLDDLSPWIDSFRNPSVILSFIENLLKIDDLSTEQRIAIYTFAAKTYAGPLHMRFEADKYAMAAANLAPNSYEAQLLAAHVFKPKDAMVYASNAARISPLSRDAYAVMLDISANSGKRDMQARVEQQLLLIDPKFSPDSTLQTNYKQKRPLQPNCINEHIIKLAAPQEFNFEIRKLLELTENYAQIFALPELPMLPTNVAPDIAHTIDEIAIAMGIENVQARFVQNALFIVSIAQDDRNVLLFNIDALKAASKPEQRFHIASALLHFKLGTLPLVLYPPDNIAMLISGLIGLYNPACSNNDVLSRLKSFIPRSVRKNITEYIDYVGVNALRADASTLQATANRLDIRIAHAFSLDLTASVSALIRRYNPNTSLPTSHPQYLRIAEKNPLFNTLLAFNISEQYSEIRKRLDIFLKMADET